MKVLVIGHTGLIGSAIFKKLVAAGIPTIGASLESDPGLNIESYSSIKRFLNLHRDISDIICAAGRTSFGNFYEMKESDFDLGVKSKLLGQIHLTMEALKQDNIKSVTLTTDRLRGN
jgi:nucleoside-diphosphate-sugar epimerase